MRSRGGREVSRYVHVQTMHRLSRHIFEVTSMRAQCESNVMARTVRVATQNGFKLTFVLPVLNRASVHGDHRDDAALG